MASAAALGCVGRCFAVPYAVSGCYQDSGSVADQVLIARFTLARKNGFGNAISENALPKTMARLAKTGRHVTSCPYHFRHSTSNRRTLPFLQRG